MASDGDHIHLDGANTDTDPYTCQSGTTEHPGIYINKTLSLIGYGSPMPQIRCSEGTGLVFIGSENSEEMTVTLSGIFFNGSDLSVQDSSVIVNGCKFEGSKQGVEFLISAKIVLSIWITNSIFSGNGGCISVVRNNTKSLSQNMQVELKLTNSSFDGNVLAHDGGCISITESPYSNQSVSCDVTLEDVTFSRNMFSSKGLVFLMMDNGNQNIHFQNVTFIDNRPFSSSRHVLTGSDYSECIARSSAVNISINSSSFTSESARSFNVSASSISLQVYNSSFCGHRVEGNGGVISLRGTDLCKLNVSNSSFVNTTAAQGGAINIDYSNVCSISFEDNVFTENTATGFGWGGGGAMYVTSAELSTNDKAELAYIGEQLLQISITKCRFTNASAYYGGALFIDTFKTSVLLLQSTFTNCSAASGGGGVLLSTRLTSPEGLIVDSSGFTGCKAEDGGSLQVYPEGTGISILNSHFLSNYANNNGGVLNVYSWGVRNASQITIEFSTLEENGAYMGGALYLGPNNRILSLREVVMKSNVAAVYSGSSEYVYGGAAVIYSGTVRVHHSRFLTNTADFAGGVFWMVDVDTVEVVDSLFDSNWASFSGGVFVICNSASNTILIVNSTFNNCTTPLYSMEDENLSLVIKRSRFTSNRCGSFGPGGALYLARESDTTFKDYGCMRDMFTPSSQNVDAKEFSLLDHKNNIFIEDTTFERNVADGGGAVFLSNGIATFRNCLFIDNLAYFAGGHIYAIGRTTSLIIQGCNFIQTVKSKVYLIHAELLEALKLYNTTVDVRPSGGTSPLVRANSRTIDLGNNELTIFNCPFGSQMETFYFNIDAPGTTTLELSCSACAGNSYSLQRGRAFGSQVASGFQCLPCPFGANCSQSILAKPNFWGFKETSNPLKLKFTMCPLGYCRPPNKTDFTEYNGCEGYRSGELCGQCNESYTETLYSTNCRPSHECKDYWFWPVALVYVSLMALYFTFKPPIVPWIKRQILWFKKRESADEDSDFDGSYLKIVFYFYQAANLLLVSNSFEDIFKTKFIEPFVGLFNFQQRFSPSGLICPFPGLTVVTKQLFSASHVLGTFLMIGGFYILHLGTRKFRGQDAPSVGPYIGGILQTMLLGYTTLASVSFNLLRCVPIGSEKRLFYDGNVVCFQWWQYILITFISTFIVPFVFVLLWGSFKLYSRTISVGKFLLACCLPLPCLLHWAYVSLLCGARSVTSQDSSSNQLSRNSVERVLYDCFKRSEDGSKLSLSWEGVMIGRRLILIVVKVFISDPFPRLLIMSFWCFLFLLHHALIQPFRNGIANVVETISLLCIVLVGMVNVFFASFLSLAVPSNDYFSSWSNVCQLVEIVILCVVPAVFGLLVAAAFLSQICRVTVVVSRFLCWVCFNWSCKKEDDEIRPLLGPAS